MNAIFGKHNVDLLRRKKLNMVEESACNCFHPMWKPTSLAVVAKVSQITPGVLVHSLS
jgi:hypothetical protein